MIIKVVKAALRLLETQLRSRGLTGPNSRTRVRETVVVVRNSKRILS